ncbi:MAG: rhomboid family intramembrane serine protease [Verrucomicrobiales bacterium]
MIFLVPYEIETLQQERPWANWLIVGLCTLVSISALFGGGLMNGDFDAFILDGFSLPGLIGHVLLHGDLIHLLGNMIFLWVFGNAICTNTNNWIYLLTFLVCTLLAATVHNLMDGSLAIGASGAINGLVGITLAMYPLNRVYLFWLFLIRGGSISCRAWLVILAWFAFDLWGVISGGGMIAYWAHIGGFLGGLGFGLTALHFGWFQLTEYDNRSLLEIIRRETPE